MGPGILPKILARKLDMGAGMSMIVIELVDEV
jgi:hypothetical protein